MTVSPFDHPVLSGLLGDGEVAALFSADADIAAMLAFERALAHAQAGSGLITAEAAQAVAAALQAPAIDIEALGAGTARDGVVVPALLKQLRAGMPAYHAAALHFGATSQDVIDTSLAIRLKALGALLDGRIAALLDLFVRLDERFGAVEVMGHTRMQAAIPVTVSRKIASWRAPLIRVRADIAAAVQRVAVLTLGGAAGTLEKFDGKGAAVAAEMAAELGLHVSEYPRHSERDGQAALASALSLLTGVLGKFGQDVALAAQSEIGEIAIASGGGSSAMPHKVNPVGAEVLVALARFNATLVSGMHQSLVHENERSGAAWTLEWMLLPQMAAAAGASLRTALDLAGNIAFHAAER